MSKKSACTTVNGAKTNTSGIRRSYILRLIGRIIVLGLCIGLWYFHPESFAVLEGSGFWREFSPLHILWGLWVIDMICQLIPVKNHLPLGSQKLYQCRFQPIREKINYPALREYVVSTTKAAYKVFILWVLLLAVIGGLHYMGIFNDITLFMITAVFYVCDLICVLIWCPFRLLMKTRCCTTCRIFNWDHLMMFSPMIFVNSFYARTLVLLAFAVFLVWELCVMMYPERFWEHSNEALKCSACTDKLCTQYCRKLRQ